MKRLLVSVALAVIAIPSSAAIQYEFTQKNSNADAVVPTKDLNARATVDGERSRVDFLGGNIYPSGTYVVSNDGSRLYFVDPTRQWYTEVNTSGVATAISASNIKVANVKSTFETLPDRPKLAGYESEHSRVTMSYDISIVMQNIPMTQHVTTEVDTWATTQLGDVPQTFLSGTARTGNAEIDALHDATAAKIKGFPLKQVVTTRTNYQASKNSQLSRTTSRTITREMWVTAIRETPTTATMFAFPATYRRADPQEVAPNAAAGVLTFEPAGGTK
ncbi:MAG TPA: hypothetical protein VEK57_25245 [Thermoanaerobaculia bacterium]|nr:hypothetical protein [Thermoanaerobaculia bacterium]